jgi:hypothetical protein
MKSMKKKTFIILAAMAMLLFAGPGLRAIETAAGKKPSGGSFPREQFRLSGGLNMFAASGSNGDYSAGNNDFPVTPACQSPAFGLGFAHFTSRSFAVGLDVGYGFSAAVDLRDPGDGETIQADTPRNLIAVLSIFQYLDLSQQMGLLFSLGGGAEYRMGEDREYGSASGSRIIIGAPTKPLSPLAAVGMGLRCMFSPALGIDLECRAIYIFRDPVQVIISPVLALVLKF